ncbi:hypothetical protein SK066_21625 [Paenibacillus hunanensis]|uniref:hypothetical protein n=1 Tax=Paenibacillus hunanensis TaxID=539262 RepID=UPI002A69D0EC|nr:hypothetical protein [Paenibacillus hunanensis]WPP41128.1 hypothetical protein SK066_21625 [Paenibacillus hunanensis]
MKKIKFLIIIPIFFVALLIIGESYILKMENFQSEYIYTTLYLQNGQNEKTMKENILKAAHDNNIDVFTFNKINSNGVVTVKIYGSEHVRDQLGKLSSVQQKKYQSVFLDDMNFEFYDLKTLKDIKDVHDFYIIGNKSDAVSFKSSLINKYAGNSPQDGYQSNNSGYIVLTLIIIVIIISSLLTYYDALYQKKASIIRISFGEKLSFIIWKNIVIDSITYIAVFGLIIYFQKDLTSILDNIQSITLFLVFLIATNAVMYTTLLSIQLKDSFSNTDIHAKRLLFLNYVIKVVTIPLIIITISSNLFFIDQSYSLYKQADFFRDHSNYSYVTTELRPVIKQNGEADAKFQESEQLQTLFYTEHFENSLLLSMIHQASTTQAPTMIANRNAISYLKERINELKSTDFKKEVYFIMPENMAHDKDNVDALLQEYSFFEGTLEPNNYEVIGYEEDTNVVAVNRNNMYGSEMYSNPIIILNNSSPIEKKLSENANRVNYMSEVMYKISNDELEQFKSKYKLSDGNAIVAKTNILDKYNEGWNKARNILYMNSVFCILMLFLEVLIILSILQLEYKVNAIELAVKKVFGYTIWQKNKHIFLVSLLTTIISSIVVIATTIYLNKDLLVLVGSIIVFFVFIEWLFIVLCIVRMEKKNIIKILKEGG